MGNYGFKAITLANNPGPIMSNNSDRSAPQTTALASQSNSDAAQLQARLARGRQAAALRVLAGRLAHQMRNPLAAVRAACNGLRAEIADPDHAETLRLALAEVDRMLEFVRIAVDDNRTRDEDPRTLDLAAEIAMVVELVRDSHADQATLIQQSDTGDRPQCVLPRENLQVAIYSALTTLVCEPEVHQVQIRIAQASDQVSIEFSVHGRLPQSEDLFCGQRSSARAKSPTGLLIAERFARDYGGQMLRSDIDQDTHKIVVTLPGQNV